MLARKMFRDIGKNLSQFITIFLMIMIGMAAYAGIESYMLGMQKTAERFYDENNLEDLIVVGSDFSSDDLKSINELTHVKKAERKLEMSAETDNDKQLLLSVIESNEISRFYVYEGEEFDGEAGVWLDRDFAVANNLGVDDEVTIIVNGQEMSQKIRALINVPDHLYDVRDSSELVPDRTQFGFAYLASGVVPMETYNMVMVDVDEIDNRDEIKNEILEAVSSAVAVLDVSATSSFARYQGEIDEGKTYVGVFSGIFLFIAMLGVVTTMTRMIKKERTQIGTLKALGFSNLRILMHYVSYGLMIALVAGMLGVWLGLFLIGKMFMKMEMDLFAIPEGQPILAPSTWGVYGMVVLVVVMISWLVGRGILKENPAESLKAEKIKVKRGAILRITDKFGKRLSFSTKWNVRDVARNKLRTIMGVAGITGCAMMLVVAFGMLDSMNYFVDLQFSKLYNFDYKMVIAEDATNSDLKKLMDEYENTSASLMIEIKDGDRVDANNAFVTDAAERIRFVDQNNTIIDAPDKSGIYVTRKLAEKYSLKVGDTISWHIMGSPKYYESEIIGLNKDPQNQNITLSREYLESLDVAYRPDAIYVEGEIDKDEIVGVSAIQEREVLRESMDEMISRIRIMIVLIIVIAVVLGVVIVYNLSVLSYVEKQYQFATLKVLGFSDRKIRQVFIQQNIWIAICAIVLGLPFGFFLTDFLFMMSLDETYDFNANIAWQTYVIAAVGVLLVSWIMSRWSARKTNKIDMVVALKADE